MSIYGKTFVLTHTFKNISKLREGYSCCDQVKRRCNIPWTIRISRIDGFLGVYLYCDHEWSAHRKLSLHAKYTMKLVAVGGKFFRRTVQHEFQKPEGHGMDKFISWENMLRDYVDNDSIIIEIHANIVSSTGFFEQKCTPCLQPNSGKSFLLNHTFKNITRFVESEFDVSDVEEHYNFSWRLKIQKLNGFLGFYLFCKKEVREERQWSIECESTLHLISANGKCHGLRDVCFFNKNLGNGKSTFISWRDMEKEYVDNDSINVQAYVRIWRSEDSGSLNKSTSNTPQTERTFVLSHTMNNMSNIKEGDKYFTDVQYRFNIPWKLQIKRRDGFIDLFLLCEKQLCPNRKWYIETESHLKLLSTNGRSLSSKVKSVFGGPNPTGNGFLKFLRWEAINERYMVNDSIVVEAHVKILGMTGIKDETPTEKTSGFTIPVGDTEYSMEKWMEMAFDH